MHYFLQVLNRNCPKSLYRGQTRALRADKTGRRKPFFAILHQQKVRSTCRYDPFSDSFYTGFSETRSPTPQLPNPCERSGGQRRGISSCCVCTPINTAREDARSRKGRGKVPGWRYATFRGQPRAGGSNSGIPPAGTAILPPWTGTSSTRPHKPQRF